MQDDSFIRYDLRKQYGQISTFLHEEQRKNSAFSETLIRYTQILYNSSLSLSRQYKIGLACRSVPFKTHVLAF